MKEITVNNYKNDKYYKPLAKAVLKILIKKDQFAAPEVFVEMSVLKQENYEKWLRGQVSYLEKVIECNLSKANRILRILGFHAHDLNLGTKIQSYKRGKNVLRCSKTNDAGVEKSYSRRFFIVGNREMFLGNKLRINLEKQENY